MAEYFNIIEQSKYRIHVDAVDDIENVSDNFLTEEEARLLFGLEPYQHYVPKRSTLHSSIQSELAKIAKELVKSGKKSIVIKDEELLEAIDLSAYNIPFYTGGKFMKHGNRMQYYKSYRREKTRCNQNDVQTLWSYMESAIEARHGVNNMPHVAGWCRRRGLFILYKKMAGWKATRRQMGRWMYNDGNKLMVKLYRHVWDNPEEYFQL